MHFRLKFNETYYIYSFRTKNSETKQLKQRVNVLYKSLYTP